MSGPRSRPAGAGRRYTIVDRLRLIRRFLAMFVVIYGLLLVFWTCRALDWLLRRQLAPRVTTLVCRSCLHILGIRLNISGLRMSHAGAVVANHSSWLDILVLNAVQQVFFVSKGEVRRWFGIGVLARSTGTVFIERKVSQARKQRATLVERLARGDKLLFFPEGTSSDGLRVLPFKTTLFAAFFEPAIHEAIFVQPMSVSYHSPEGEREDFYAWFADAEMLPHLVKVLSAPKGGHVDVVFHQPLKASEFADRKQLARECERIVRDGKSIGNREAADPN
ncbi:MAG: lysophospholipid acyltransferase family protein [Rhodobacteraceae bacterium]|nr:lysophospholipid acyltransferase family protein [Paracoccaceae bacterium]